MTGPADADRLVEMVARCSVLLLDFDGPICRLFAGEPAPAIAERLRAIAAEYGADVPAPEPSDDGPLQVLRRVADLGNPELTRRVADEVRDAEVQATATATPTPGAADVMQAAKATGRRIAIVSNNSEEAVLAYLGAHQLANYVDLVAARHDGLDPRLLKPNPHLLSQALRQLDTEPASALFVGDSLSDIHAGQTAATPTLGHANKPGKRQAFLDAGLDAVTDRIYALIPALHAKKPNTQDSGADADG